jgi:tetratricopeptide (TPR) repeat protein
VANAQIPQGIQFYAQAMAARPTDFSAYADLIRLYGTLQDLNSAFTTAKKARQLIPGDLGPRLLLERVYLAKQDPMGALNTLNEALPLFPYEQGMIYTDLGNFFAKTDNPDSALDAFHTAEARDPKLIEPYLGEGDLYLSHLGNPQKALELYQQAASIDGKSPIVYAKILKVYASERQGRPTLIYDPTTCPFLPRLIHCDIDGVNLHSGLDNALTWQYETNAKADPNSIEAQIGVAMLYEAFHWYDQSIAAWQRVLALDPANQDALVFLSHDYSLRETGRLGSAYSMGQAMALGVDDQPAYKRLATLYNDHITSPQDGAILGNQVTITGTANGSNSGSRFPFNFYKVEVGVGSDPKQWIGLYQTHSPVTEGILATWDTSGWANGVYTIRLVVVDQSGNYRPWDKRTIRVQH